jgi:Secretion system C-terminal sorting domain
MKKSLLLLAFFSMGLVAYGQVKVTFSVDMSVYQKGNTFNNKPVGDSVSVAGDFNGWNTSANWLTRGTGADSTIFSAQIDTVSAGVHNYKFTYTQGGVLNWESIDNRTANIGVHDTTLPTVLFNNINGTKEHVWFKVDMTLPLKAAALSLTDTVGVTGDFTGWGTSGTGFLKMTRGASDSVYTVLADTIASGRTVQFKYIYLHAGVNWENPTLNLSAQNNRQYFVPQQDSTTFSAFWNDVNPNVTTGSGNINFTCDMSVMVRVGIFNTAVDSVLISAGFNGWTTNSPTAWLNQDASNDSSYYITQTFTNAPYGDNPYKYYVHQHNPTGIDTIWSDGYERPVHWGGGNRETSFKGLASMDTMDYYDGIHPDWFIPHGTNLHVVFSVDMNPAMNAGLQAIPFDPVNDTLYWLSEEPAFARAEKWYRPADGHMRILKLTAQGAGIYSGTLNVSDPSFNAFEYRYEWQKGSDGTWVTEPSGFDAFDYRVRYVGQDVASHFPKNPWNMPKDTWTNSPVKADQEKDPYTSLTGVKTVSQNPMTYSLSQNYPNPFNPSTKINFSIQKAGVVTLKIYNILGQEVATLVNYDLKPGAYSATFDASRLSSGVYFYTIHSGNFVQSKKMMLLK